MATTSSTTSAPAGSAAIDAPSVDRRAPWALVVALVAVAVAFGVTAVRALSDLDESFRYAGDQAVFGLAVDEASRFHRELGPYSRYGWAHPGPLWFYLLAPVSRLFGGGDAALVAANVTVNGLVAAALVVAVHRAHRPALTLTVTGLVLVFVLRMPREMFVDAWSPYALLMGTLLFLVLAARVHRGSWPTFLAMLIAGSFLVQTHVGTAPLVAIVGTTGGIGFYLRRRALRRTATSDRGLVDGLPHRRRAWTVALGVLLVAVWVPPVVQQLSSPLRQGNLVRLVSFFLHPEGGPRQAPFHALVAVGRILAMTPYGWGPGPYEMDVDVLPASLKVVLVVQVVASAGLVALGLRLGSSSGLWWGIITLTGLVAAFVSAGTVTGTLFWYLIAWVSVLPVATVIGYAHLAFDGRGERRDPPPSSGAASGRTAALAVLAAGVLAGSVAAATTLDDALTSLPASGEVVAASQLVEDGLGDVEGRTVHVDMQPHKLWPIGAGVIRGLVSDGWTVSVDPEFEDIFGSPRADAEGGPVDVFLVYTDGPAYQGLAGVAGVRDMGAFATQYGPVSVLVRVDR